jgi:hypothetical protein
MSMCVPSAFFENKVLGSQPVILFYLYIYCIKGDSAIYLAAPFLFLLLLLLLLLPSIFQCCNSSDVCCCLLDDENDGFELPMFGFLVQCLIH